MSSIYIFRRDLRLSDNTALIRADSNEKEVIPIFICDPYQLENNNKSNNCVQFMVESLLDLKQQLKKNGSELHTCYGHPWDVIETMCKNMDIKNVYINMDYTKYSKYRDNKILNVCKKNKIELLVSEDLLLNDVEKVKTSTGKYYEKFTPFYENARKYVIRTPTKHTFKHLVKKKLPSKISFDKLNKLYTNNPDLYIRGGRTNGLKLLNSIGSRCHKYNENKNFPIHDTSLLSPHNKFGTISIREEFYYMKKKLGSRNEILRQLYWRDFYYAIVYHNVNYLDLNVGKYAKMTWKNDSTLFRKWKIGKTGIPMVDAGIEQLKRTGWIHNRVRLILASMLTKIYGIDWRYGEKFFKKHLIDYDITQNTMNWYWVSSEVPFANPYFRILNPIVQSEKYDDKCEYSQKWIDIKECENKISVDYVSNAIKRSIVKYAK